MAAPQKQKQQSDVRGVQMKCTMFAACPMCYGCRNYSSSSPDCQECLPEKKKNICDIKRHQSDTIAKMVSKNRIQLNNLNFKSHEGDSSCQ